MPATTMVISSSISVKPACGMRARLAGRRQGSWAMVMFPYVIVYLWKYTPVTSKARNSCELFNDKCQWNVGKWGMAAGLMAFGPMAVLEGDCAVRGRAR